jgi:hypothetical protein
MMRKILATACGVTLAGFVGTTALAQRGPGGPMAASRYDPKAEVTVTGTIEKITESASRRGLRMGRHVTLKTDGGTFEVHLGPVGYWKKNGFDLAKGDTIAVTGSKSKVDDTEVIRAREVRKGEKAVTLRNAQGVPLWSRGRRSP